MSTNTAREENKDAMEKISTTDVSGGVLPRELRDEWFEEVQDESVVLNRVRTVDMPREKMRVPKIGVGERLRTSQAEGTANSEAGVSTDSIDMDAEKGAVYWSLTREAVEDSVDDVPDIVLSQMSQQWAVDTEDLGFNGDESTTGFTAQNDGWFTIAESRGAPVYHHDDAGDGTGNPQPINNDMFHGAIQTLDSKYLRSDPSFIVNQKQLQEYANNLIGREDGLGAQVLLGESEVNPFGYDVVGTAMCPEDKALFTPEENLLYGIHRDVEIDVLEDSDDIHEQDLFAKYAIRARDDFQVEDENACVRIEGIQTVN